MGFPRWTTIYRGAVFDGDAVAELLLERNVDGLSDMYCDGQTCRDILADRNDLRRGNAYENVEGVLLEYNTLKIRMGSHD